MPWGSAYNGGAPKAPPQSIPSPSGGGWGSAFRSTPAANIPTVAPTKPSGGDGIGGFIKSAEKAVGGAAHAVASKADLAAHDIAAIPTGIAAVVPAFAKDVATMVEHPLRKQGPSWGQLFSHPERALTQNANGSQLAPLVGASLKGTQTSFQHPLRDPFQTALNAAAAAAPVAGIAARGAAAANAVRAGELGTVAKALASKPPVVPRIIQVPKLVAPAGEGPAQLVHEPVQLMASTSPLSRAAQALHDVVGQKALDRNVSTAEPSRVASYMNRRVGKVVGETARTSQRTNLVPAQMLARTKNFDEGVSKKAGQLALFLRSANVTGQEAAHYWAGQAARGVNPTDTGALAKLAQQVHDQGLVGLGHDGNVSVDAARFPKLANADNLVRENQASREAIIREHGLMQPETMKNRLDLVARTMANPGRVEAQAAARPIQAQINKLEGLQKARHVPERAAAVSKYTGIEQKLDQLRASLPAVPEEVSPVREGQGYTPLKTTVKRQPQTPIAAARPPLIGKVRGFITAKKATGVGVAKGLVPDNTTAGVANANREALRYLGTVQHRGLVVRYGSDVRRTGDDVLTADPTAAKYGNIPAKTNELLGRSTSTLNTVGEEEHQGLAAAMKARMEDAIPGLRDKFSADRAAALGTRAPEGYKWVPRSMLGDLVQETSPRWALTKGINNVNSAVTAATVYFKVSHIPQRLTTNATTSLLAGALKPASIRAAILMRKALTDREYAEAVAASGTHGYLALPNEGTGRVARIASKGANFYAHQIDSPFRFLNLVNEARQAGFTTPEQFRALLEHAKNPGEVGSAADAARNARMDYVLRRSNRVSMMYDGLGANEKRILARGLWFYPWTKAAVRFAGHTLGEHPLKTGGLEAFGKLGEQRQASVLGALPSYEYALTPFGGGPNPETSNLGVMEPFGTAANVVEALARPGSVSQFANPVAGGALTALTGVNQYGNKSKSPISDALGQMFAPTPEMQILSAYLHPPKPTQIFRKTPLSQFERSLGGPSLPRRTNKAALNKAAAREKSGR